MTHCFSLECCTKTHNYLWSAFLFVVIFAYAWYFVAFCQRLIYEYMDMDMDMDYCNGVLIGQPANLIRRLQSVQNAAARLIFDIRGIRRSEHIMDAFASFQFHWLRVPERILESRCTHLPSCERQCACVSVVLLHPRRRDVPSRSRLRSSNSAWACTIRSGCYRAENK